MPPYYIATQPFGPQAGEAWTRYQAWSGLTHLREVVSPDQILCPPIIQELTAADWAHNVQEDYRTLFFQDLDYLLGRVPDLAALNLLAVLPEPEPGDLLSFPGGRFQFEGFDLVERPGGGISALVNCGGFERAFQPSDLNEVGLLPELDLARNVRRRLLQEYPREPHADCLVWALWRMKSEPFSGQS